MIKLKNLLPECENCGRDWNHGHDHEASMAKNELRDMISNASKINNLVGDNDQLPGWVSAYISLAADYMHSVSEFLAGESTEAEHQPGPGFNMMEVNKPSARLSKEEKSNTVKNEMFPPYKSNMVNKVRYKASDTFTNDPKVAKKKGYLEIKN